jgi:DNA-directed RNA polymerase specialized sigma subunit
MSNNNEQNIKLKFIPIKDNSFITKYLFFNRYGNFEIINENINDDVPNISHLSSDLSEELNEEPFNKEIDNNELNFDINDIIASETDNIFIKNKNINNELFKEDLEYNNSDTENDTTESMINKALN